MTAPVWINAIVGDFGHAAGLSDFALNDRGSAALDFETGRSLRLEYTGTELVIAMTLAMHSPSDLARLLSLPNPHAKYGFKIRTGLLAKSGRLVMAIRIAERDTTLANLSGAFQTLWHLANEIGGAA